MHFSYVGVLVKTASQTRSEMKIMSMTRSRKTMRYLMRLFVEQCKRIVYIHDVRCNVLIFAWTFGRFMKTVGVFIAIMVTGSYQI